ncbi:DUF6059 family protein [Streptomyces sp. NPDC002588]|uniref:DUF6059 family protein n=1 Tax=Streptomyces sp. NPDC002588 TaxID=3154419 RepID=UPI003325AD1F
MASQHHSLIRMMLRSAYRALVAFGGIWVHTPPVVLDERLPPVRRAPGGIPAGHPERLCPEVSLSTTELALELQLRDLAEEGGGWSS